MPTPRQPSGAAASRRVPPPGEPLRIQKYPNRRLYDRTASRHLTTEQLHALVAEGHRVQISDSRTGEDITNVVLAQLLLERDPMKLGVFPPEFFHLLIRAGQRAIPSFQRAIAESTIGLARGWTDWRAWSEPMAALIEAASTSADRPPRPRGALPGSMHALFPWLAPSVESGADAGQPRASSEGPGSQRRSRKRAGGAAPSPTTRPPKGGRAPGPPHTSDQSPDPTQDQTQASIASLHRTVEALRRKLDRMKATPEEARRQARREVRKTGNALPQSSSAIDGRGTSAPRQRRRRGRTSSS